MIATPSASIFTPQEIARARALQSADSELCDVPVEDIAAFLADEIPPAAYEGSHGAH